MPVLLRKWLIFGLIGNFVLLSLLCFWADSESWPVKVAGISGDLRVHFDYSVKPLFLMVLSPVLGVSELLGVYHMDLARLLFAINGLAIVWLGVQITKKLTGSAFASSFFFILIMTSRLFLERGFRVRSDLLVTSLVFLLIYFLLEKKWSLHQRWIAFLVTTCLVAGLTLKSLLVLLCLMPLILSLLLPDSKLDWRLFRTTTFYIFLGGVVLFSVVDHQAYEKQWDYFLSQFGIQQVGVPLFHPIRYQYVLSFLRENPLIVFLLGYKAYRSFRYRDQFRPVNHGFDLSVLLLLILILLYPNRLPFFLVSILPFLIIGSLNYPWQSRVWREWEPVYSKSFYRYPVLLILLTFSTWSSLEVYLGHTNLEQRQLVREFIQYINHRSDLKFYDPTGLIPNPGVYHNYLGPGQSADNDEIFWQLVQREEIDFFFEGQRLDWVAKSVEKISKAMYLKVPPGLILKGYEIAKQSKDGILPADTVHKEVQELIRSRHIEPRKIILREVDAYKVSGEGQIKIILNGRKMSYPLEGLSLRQFQRIQSFEVTSETMRVGAFFIDFTSSVDHLEVRKLMSFDNWL